MNSEEVSSCPVCRGTTFVNSFSSTDFTTTGETFHVKHCRDCGLGITSPRPREEESMHYYQSADYISHRTSGKGLIDSIYLIIRVFTMQWKYRLVTPYLKSGGLLDYGCGTGTFLKEVHGHHHDAFGVEPSPDARARVSSGITVAANLNELPTKTFNVITLWHVLEHVYALRETLRALKDRLADGGALFLAVPNHESVDAKHYGHHWAAYDVPRHLWHFTRKSMAAFLQQEGLRVVKVIPMKLDAYYVSMLSERYARPDSGGLLRILRAAWIAFRANRAARKEGNYSSLIYIVQK